MTRLRLWHLLRNGVCLHKTNSVFSVLLSVSLILCGTHGQGYAQTPPATTEDRYIQRSDDDLLLLSVHLDNLALTQDMEAYQSSGGALLPLGEVCRLLELAVTVSPSTGTADGFVARPDRRFHVDIRTHQASLSGKELPFDPAMVELHRNDIFVDSRLLNLWLALGLEYDAHEAAVRVHPREPLPMQKRLERERRAAQSRSLFSTYHDPGYPLVLNPYQMLSGPAIDQSLTLNSLPAKGSGGTSFLYATQIAADIAQLGLNAYITAEPGHAVTAPQITLGQMDSGGNLLGGLHAREVMLGRTYASAVPLISDARLVNELLLSSYPLYRSNQFDATTLSGVLPAGWDVELYRDEALIDYQQANITGRYEFKNIALTFGNNRYRLVFYGPHGERQEQSRDFNVGDALTPYRANWYRLALQPERNGDFRYSFQDDFGLRPNLSTAIGLTTVRLADGVHTYGTTGLRGFAGGLLGYINLVGDPQTGTAEEVGLQWQWKRTTVALKQTLLQGLVSETLSPTVNPIHEQTTLHVGNILLPRWTHLLPMDLEAIHERTRTGTERWELHDRLSYQSRRLGVTNWLFYKSEIDSLTQQQSPQSSVLSTPVLSQSVEPFYQRLSQGQGQLLINQWQHNRLLQGQVSYDWAPKPRWEQLSLQIQQVLPDQRLRTLGVYYANSNTNYGITATISRNIETYSYGLSADLSTKRGLNIGMTVSMGLLRNPQKGTWDSSAQSQSTRGAVLARVYLDTNGNAKKDPGEPEISGVDFFVNALSYGKSTDKNGSVLINGLTQFAPADISISVASLSNPLWIPECGGTRIIPRPGNIPILDFPIVSTGEVAGTVYFKDTAGTHEASGIALELMDTVGNVLQKQTTAYDGFYTFSRVPIGLFHIRVAPGQFGVAGATTASVFVQIPPEGTFLDGINLILER